MPADDDLCGITFELYKTEVGSGEETITVYGVNFACVPTDKCNEKNKETNKEKEKLKKDIDAEQKKIDDANKAIKDDDKIIGDDKKKPQHEQAKADKKRAEGEKKEAEKKQAGLKDELKKCGPECTLKFLVATGGDETVKYSLTLDQIKKKKIEYAVCLCVKVAPPKKK